MSYELAGWHWRDTMRPARFIMFDARAAFFIVFVLIRLFSPYTWGLFFSALTFFYILERFGLTFEAALRRARAWMCGNARPALIWTSNRRMLDLGRMD